MDIFCEVTRMGLVPMYDSDGEQLHKLRKGDVVKCHITRSRNVGHHKKFFALLRMVTDNLPERVAEENCIYGTESLLNCIKEDLGLYSIVYDRRGREVVRYDSISFDSMAQDEFETFYKAAVNVIMDKYMRGVTEEDIREELINFM